ncbi:MAG: ribosome maturation factor RimM [Prevotellaceae bacterium]|jgi:16S rRNA processing protein RimM|nr:ribosome maturation factor RimM [Prevotellaceae bacterium]
MILEKEIFPVGKILKPHGVRGEILISLPVDVLCNDDFKFIILEIEGIFVPFFIDQYRVNSSETAFLTLDGISDEKAAKELTGKTVFAPEKYSKKMKINEPVIEYFIGFQVFCGKSQLLGTITDFDRTTSNVLMMISTDEKQLLVPFSESYIIDIDYAGKQIFADLPDGLLEL